MFFFRLLIKRTVILLLPLIILTATATTVRAQVLRVGLVPEYDIFTQKTLYQQLFDYLNEQQGFSFELRMLPHHDMLVEAFAGNELDAAFFGSLTGAIVIETLDMIPLVRPHFSEGLSSDYGVIFVRRQGGIDNIDDMRDRRIVFVDPLSATGYLLPLLSLRDKGMDDYRSWFKQHYFAGTHEDTIYEVLKGHADVGTCKSSIFYNIARTNPEILEQLEILASSAHVPALTFGVQSHLNRGSVILLHETLANMHETPSGRETLNKMGIQRFITTTRKDFLPVRDYAEQLGVDFADVPYLHE